MLSYLSCDTSAERLACAATASVAAGIFLSDAGTAVAALGILSTVLANRDCLACYLTLTPLCVISDVVWIFTGHASKLVRAC
jgi:hypothetical protein